MIMFLEILILFIVLLIGWTVFENGNSALPPGPLRIPVLGTLLQIGLTDPGYKAFHKLSKKYGDVMQLKLGVVNAVVLSSYESIKDVFNRDEALGRHSKGMFWDRMMYEDSGMIFSNGHIWTENRKFCKETLGEYGLGNRTATEQMIQEEIEHIIIQIMKSSNINENLKKSIGRINSSEFHFRFTAANLVTRLMTGARHSFEDVEMQDLLKATKDFAQSSLLANEIMTAYPFIRFVFPNAMGYNIQQDASSQIRGYAKNFLEKRRKHDYRNNPRCFTDDFLNQMEDKAKEGDTSVTIFTEKNFMILFSDLLQAGVDTSSNVLTYTILLLMCHPKVQYKMYQEILDVCGTDRLPTMVDRASMPYTKAVNLEGLRWARTATLGIPRRATSDFTYRNFLIKKDTMLVMNNHTVFMDENYWGDPLVFRPERFLDKNNKLIPSKAERINISFGAGKRNCFGEVLARDSIYLIITALIQQFSFELPEDQKNPSLEPLAGFFALSPHPYDAIVKLR